MICRECGSKMYEDDRDTRWKDNFDIYWNCEKCQTGCIAEYRFGRPFREIWHSENEGVKDYIVKNGSVK